MKKKEMTEEKEGKEEKEKEEGKKFLRTDRQTEILGDLKRSPSLCWSKSEKYAFATMMFTTL